MPVSGLSQGLGRGSGHSAWWQAAVGALSLTPTRTNFGLTLVRDLTTGIVAGCVLAALFAAIKQNVPEEGG
jgi:hypothetical protein